MNRRHLVRRTPLALLMAVLLGTGMAWTGAGSPARADDPSTGGFLTVTTEPEVLNFPALKPGDRVEFLVTVSSVLPGRAHLSIAVHALPEIGLFDQNHGIHTIDIAQCSGDWNLRTPQQTTGAECSRELALTMAPTAVRHSQPLRADLGVLDAGKRTYRFGLTFDRDFATSQVIKGSTRFEITAAGEPPGGEDLRDGAGNSSLLPHTGGLADPRWVVLIAFGALLATIARRRSAKTAEDSEISSQVRHSSGTA